MEFVKHIISSSLLLCGLLIAWPGQGVFAQEGEGVRLLALDANEDGIPDREETILLQVVGVNVATFGEFATFNDGMNDTNRLVIAVKDAAEIVNIGLSLRADFNGDILPNSEYFFLIRDISPGAAREVVHGPFRIANAAQNINNWAEAGFGAYATDRELPVYELNGNNVPTQVSGLTDTPYRFAPGKAGTFSIEFIGGTPGENPFYLPFWNFTVVDDNDEVQTGRLWSKNWVFRTPPENLDTSTFCLWDRAFAGDFHSYTSDSLVSRINFENTNMRGLTFNVAFNSTGPGTSENLLERRRSVQGENASINSAEHQIFLSPPDPELFPTEISECATVTVRDEALSCVEGDFCLPITISAPGQVALSLFTGEDVEIPLSLNDYPRSIFPASGGLDTCIAITNLESIAGDAGSIRLKVTYLRGAQHWAAYDVELMDMGFCVTTDLPASCLSIPGFVSGDNTLYWDDSNIDLEPGGNGVQVSPPGGASCEMDLRSWNNFDIGQQTSCSNFRDSLTSGYGDKSTLNTWWYAYTQELDVIEIPVPTVAIIGPDTVCSPLEVVYRVNSVGFDSTEVLTYSWTGPNGIVGSLDSIIAIGEGEYCVIVTNENGCERSDCKTLSIGEGRAPDVSLPTLVEAFCPEAEITLSVINNDPNQTLAFEWTPLTAFVDNTLASPDYLEEQGEQELMVRVTNRESGCDTLLTVNVVFPDTTDLTATVAFDDVCTPVDTLRATVTGDATVDWLDADGIVVGSGLELVTNTEEGTFTFTARATNAACQDTVFSAPLTVRYEPVNISVMGPADPVCAGDEVVLSVTNEDPMDTLTYVWSPGSAFVDSTLATPDYLEASGSQTVTVSATNQFGCTDSRTIDLTISDPITLEATVAFDDICTPVDTLRATVTGDATVDWLDADGMVVGSGLVLVTNTGEGTFTFTARATNAACQDTVFSAPLTVRYEPVNISVMGPADPVCAGDEVVLSVTNEDPMDTLTYAWSPGSAFVDSTLATPDYLEASGSQTVTVTATNQFGCTDTRTIDITISDPITLEATVAFDDICTPVDTLRATVTGDATVDWLDANGTVVGSGLELVTNTEEGTFTFTARATNAACQDTVFSAPLTVRYEPVNISVMGPADPVCAGDEVVLSVTNEDPMDTLTYAWSPGSAFVDSTLATPDYLEASGSQTVTVTATNQFGCTDTRTIDLTISDPITLEATVAFDDICTPVDTLRATVTGDATVDWLDADGMVVGSGLVLVTNTGEGTTTFTARATNAACQDTVFSAPLTVRYEPVNISVMGPADPVCAGDEVVLSVTNEDPMDTLTYAWSPGSAFVDSTLATPDYLEASGSQTVTVTATNQFDCTDSRTIDLTISDPITLEATVAFDDICTPVDTLRATVTGDATVDWLDADGMVVGSGLVLVTNTGEGTTTFTARATNAACQDTVFSAPLTVRYEPVNISVMGPADPVCAGDEVVLSVTNEDPMDTLTYAWTPGSAFVDSTLAMPDYLEASGSQTVTVTATNQFDCTDSRTIDLTISDPITLEATVAFDDICTPVDTLRATVTGDATVDWLDADGTVVGSGLELVTNTEEGTFTFMARATNAACQDTVFSAPLTVRYEPVNISVDGPAGPVCASDPVILSITNEDPMDTLTYAWSPGSAFVDSTLAMPDYLEEQGSQTVTVMATNQFGCTDTRTIDLTISDPITLEATVAFDDICTPVDTLRATVTGDATVDWLDADGTVVGSGLELVTNTEEGTFTFTARATNAACQDTVFSEPLTVRYEPVNISVMGPADPVCAGDEVVLSVTNEDPMDTLTYAWSPGSAFVDSTLAMPDYLEEQGSQTVTVTATNQFGCTDSRTIDITISDPITLEATVAFDDICTPVDTLRATVTGDATVDWLDADGMVVGSGLVLVTNTGEGTTTFTARATNAACQDTVFSAPLTVRYEPVNISVDGPAGPVCATDPVILSITNEDPMDTLTYAWSPGSAFVDSTLAMPDYLEEQGSQTVTVTATNQFGCTDSRTIDITISDPITLEATVAFDDICTPVDTLRATVTGDATVDWLDADGMVVGSGLVLVTNTGEGATTFTARATNAACQDTLFSEPLTVRFEPVSIFVEQECLSTSVSLNVINNNPDNQLRYVWSPANAFADNTLAMPDYDEEFGNQTVTVTATNEFGCESTASVTIDCEFDECVGDVVYIPNFFTPNGDNSNDVIRLRSKFIEEILEVELMIYNRWGEEIFRTTDKFAQWDGTFRGEQLAPDVYGFWLRYSCPGGEQTIRKGNITLMR